MTELAIRCQVCGEVLGACRCSVKHLRADQGIDIGGLVLPIRHVIYWEQAPHVHRHFLTADADADLLGFAALELCCHGCGRAVVVKFVLPSPEEMDRALAAIPEAERHSGLGKPQALAERFQAAHAACRSLGGEFLCPPARQETDYLDWTKEPLV